MPKVAKELGALAVSKLAHPNPSSDKPTLRPVGGAAGLMLKITPNGSKSWILRTMVGSKRRHIGLGSYPEISLAAARQKATEARETVRRGIDPIEQRRAARAALAAEQARNLTFAEAWERYWNIKAAELDGEKNQNRWRYTVDQYALPALGKMRVADINLSDVLRLLQQPYQNHRTGADGPFWNVANETAIKVRSRIEEILAWATVNGHRTGDNPARWKDNLDMTLPAPGKVAITVHQPAISLADAPAWFATLRLRDSVSAYALQFVAMTAARSGDVRGATWSEIDLDAALWTVPATRMKVKGNGDHIVPLADEAVKLLKRLDQSTAYVFPAPRRGPLSDMALSMLMRGMNETETNAGRKGWLDRQSGKPAVVHGLRSTFRDWAAEHTEYPSDMAEIALAHKVGNEVQQAYRRGTMVQKRRQMMSDWVAFLLGQ